MKLPGPDTTRGGAELRATLDGQRGLLAIVVLFSAVVNLLMLTGPLYMLQVYDRVLGSQSVETLVALTGLIAFLFLVMGVLDHARARIMARVGAQVQERLDRRAFAAALRRLSLAPDDPLALAAQRDVEALQRFWSSPVVLAIIDTPWTPVYIAAIFVFHPVLGVLAIGGGVVIVAVALLNQIRTRHLLAKVNGATMRAERIGEMMKAESETILSLGMTGAAFDRWQQARATALAEGVSAGDVGGAFAATSKTFRLFLQSAMLGLAAWLVLHNELTSGAMIAASIIMGRALQPIEQLVGQWATVTRAREAQERLARMLSATPETPERTALPRPAARIDVQALTVVPPGESQPSLRAVSMAVEPGQAVGVIGPSGAGKTTLARALAGVWAPSSGKIRLDGATLDQFDPDVLGGYIGYLPQRISLFDGTIAENIARLGRADDASVVQAARAAAAHEMILRLPDGYDTRVTAIGNRLSGGQIQRIGLARALYGNPVFLILDEPNSNLDNEGSAALNRAIRGMKDRGGAVLIMAHRPAAIQQCDLLLVLDDGRVRAFGPRDQVLREMVGNHTEIARAAGAGGVA